MNRESTALREKVVSRNRLIHDSTHRKCPGKAEMQGGRGQRKGEGEVTIIVSQRVLQLTSSLVSNPEADHQSRRIGVVPFSFKSSISACNSYDAHSLYVKKVGVFA